MIPVSVGNLSISNVGFVVFLKSDESEKTVPIFIGGPEAQAIALRMNDVSPPRPMTHDLLKNVMDAFEARLERVEVNNLQEGTFYAQLTVEFEGQRMEIDSRPSDAIALALRYNAPIFVSEEVMAEAGVIVESKEGGDGDGNGDGETAPENEAAEEQPPQDRLEQLKARLGKAVEEERYEEAARLRDEIRRAASSN